MNEALYKLAEAQLKNAELLRLQLEAQQRQNEILLQLVGQPKTDKILVKELFDNAMKVAQETTQNPNLVPMGTGNSQTSQQNISIEVGQKSTNTPKLDFAIEWLKSNPDDITKSGRALENEVLMEGETISYKWWNRAKKEL